MMLYYLVYQVKYFEYLGIYFIIGIVRGKLEHNEAELT